MMRKMIVFALILPLLCMSLLVHSAPRHADAVGAGAPRATAQTLTLFDWGTFEGAHPFSSQAGLKLVAQWKRMHPNVTLKFLPMPAGDPTIYLESLLAAGAAPDILIPAFTLQIFSDLPKHYWLDLTPYLNKPNRYVPGNKRWRDLMNPIMNAQDAFAGHYYVTSFNANDVLFFYNKDIFRKVGITRTPTTWAEMLADSNRIKHAGYIPDLYFLGDTYPTDENGSVLAQFENQVMSKTFQRLDANHDGVVDIKELVYGIQHHLYSPMNADYQEAWRLYKQWAQYWQPNAAGNKGGVAGSPMMSNQLFIKGKAAMTYESTNLSLTLAQAKVGFHWGVFRFPQITPSSSRFATPGEKGTGLWGAWNAGPWGIATSTVKHGHLALALDFLQWITVPQHAVTILRGSGSWPVAVGYQPNKNDVIDSMSYDVLKHPQMIFAAEATLGPEWLRDRISVQQEYLTGQVSLQQAMADMQRYTDQAAARASKILNQMKS